MLYDQLAAYVEEQNILPTEQHGFRAGRGVDTALATAFSKIAKASDQRKKIGIAAYDFSSAFDTVEKSCQEKQEENSLGDCGGSMDFNLNCFLWFLTF